MLHYHPSPPVANGGYTRKNVTSALHSKLITMVVLGQKPNGASSWHALY